MASPRELLEARRFERRRLVSAFMTGAAGARDCAPAPVGRIVVIGLAVGVLLLAGALVASVLGAAASRSLDTERRPGGVGAIQGKPSPERPLLPDE